MGTYSVISTDAVDELQLEVGVLLSTFDPGSPGEPASSNIIATTTGGIQISAVPTYSDFGDDIDNVPPNMMEFKHLDGWECSMSFSSLRFNEANVHWSLGAATSTTNSTDGYTKIVPNRDLDESNFADIWWVGDKSNGGAVAVKLLNALSTGGLNIQTNKNGKGTNQVTLTGHVSIDHQDVMPMEVYIIDAGD